jgi:hypothetical protein
MKLLIMQFSPPSSYYASLVYKYSPQRPVLKLITNKLASKLLRNVTFTRNLIIVRSSSDAVTRPRAAG